MIDTVILLTIAGIAIVAFECLRNRPVIFDFLFFFNASFLVYYVLAPIHLIFGGAEYATLPNIQAAYFSNGDHAMLVLAVAALCVLGYSCTIAGYYAGSMHTSVPRRWILVDLPDRVVIAAGLAMFAIGLAACLAYAAQFDSLLAAITDAVVIRAGETDDAGQLAFLRNLIPLAAVLAPLLVAVRLRQEIVLSPSLSQSLIVLVAMIAVVCLLTQGSRRALMIFAMEFYFLLANFRRRIYFGRMAIVAGFTLLLLFFGDVFSLGLALGTDFVTQGISTTDVGSFTFFYESFWRDFTYTYQATIAVVDRYEGIPRLLVDLPLAVIDLLPERLIPLQLPPPLSADSTLLTTDIPVPLTAEIPPGYIGYFWYAGYAFGVPFGCFLYGLCGGKLAAHLARRGSRDPVWMLFYVYFAFMFGYFVREGIPAMILVERFHWFIAAAVVGLLALRRVHASATTGVAGQSPALGSDALTNQRSYT